METILIIKELEKSFGGVKALNGASFDVLDGEILGLIGPNGAGKTTLVNVVTGLLGLDKGSIVYGESKIENWPSYKVAREGILGRTFQITGGFRELTVRENLLVPTLVRSMGNRERKAKEIMDFLTIDHLSNEKAKNLSGGQQKLLELGRVLMLDPEVIFLDEPFAGVHPELSKQIHQYIKDIQIQGKTFVIISHDLDSVFKLSERIVVLSDGKVISTGEPSKVKQDDNVIEAYLGV